MREYVKAEIAVVKENFRENKLSAGSTTNIINFYMIKIESIVLSASTVDDV